MSHQRRLAPESGQDTQSPRAWEPSADGRCRWGASVGARVARVLGVDGVVPACRECWATPDGREYRSTVTATRAFRDGQGRPVEVDG